MHVGNLSDVFSTETVQKVRALMSCTIIELLSTTVDDDEIFVTIAGYIYH